MAEGTYEYECMRAELLGVEKPDYEEFMKKMESEKKVAEDEDLEAEFLKEAEQVESEKRILGGLEELNSILQKTQTKINRFKASCGSLTNLLKIKVTGKSDSSSSLNGNSIAAQDDAMDNQERNNENSVIDNPDSNDSGGEEESGRKQRKSDLAKVLDSDLSRLDAMIEKAENAQYSMSHQSKQMKKFLN